MEATFTLAADTIAAAETCLRAMCGVGVSRAGNALAVTIYAPFGVDRLAAVRAVIAGVDPNAVES